MWDSSHRSTQTILKTPLLSILYVRFLKQDLSNVVKGKVDFQFSMWDSAAITTLVQRWLGIFQFSMWDSWKSRKLGTSLSVSAFNSLCEILSLE